MNERWIPFDVADADVNPFAQWRRWYEEGSREVREPEAIAVSTANLQGRISSRMVLLRTADEQGFVWFTNYNSHKGHDLAENPRAAILWYCEPLGRQVRIAGRVTRVSDAESDEYFNSRPRGHQIGAHASNQSEPLATRQELEDRVRSLEAEFDGREIPRPAHWGGFRLVPEHFEFWQHRKDRLHDRVLYDLVNGAWSLARYAP
jgi:pyridoxamine 5'-phosphate oxidase